MRMVLDDWLSEQEAAAEIKKSVRTLRAWRRRGKGPPYALFGRTIRYRRAGLIEHFRTIEVHPSARRRVGRAGRSGV
jgi:Helix-turn-helix domain